VGRRPFAADVAGQRDLKGIAVRGQRIGTVLLKGEGLVEADGFRGQLVSGHAAMIDLPPGPSKRSENLLLDP
jgi:hypothetical protein